LGAMTISISSLDFVMGVDPSIDLSVTAVLEPANSVMLSTGLLGLAGLQVPGKSASPRGCGVQGRGLLRLQ
jgi:hypothetical protein